MVLSPLYIILWIHHLSVPLKIVKNLCLLPRSLAPSIATHATQKIDVPTVLEIPFSITGESLRWAKQTDWLL